MEIGIVGLPNVGKSTLFNVLTHTYGAEVGNFPFCTIEPNVGMVQVEDPRLYQLKEITHTQKVIPATVRFVDIAGIVKGASEGEGLGNKFLSHIRQVDAIAQVVRVFDDPNISHVHGEINPKQDIEIIQTELIMADLETIRKRIGNTEKLARSGQKDAKTLLERYTALETHLLAGNLAYTCFDTSEDVEMVKDLFLLTMKPFLYAVNLPEDKVTMSEAELRSLIGVTDTAFPVVGFSGKMELDMLGFDYEDRQEYLSSLGLTQSPTDILIKTAYDLLGLQYFFTAGEIEVRAWTITKGMKAPEAAGVIHTDFQKKFIRAEVINWKDFVDLGGWSKSKEQGKARLEGKEYIMQEGDVVYFRIGA